MSTKALLSALAILVTFASGYAQGNTLALVDREGSALAQLPMIARGDERLVPLVLLAKPANFEIVDERGKKTIASYECVTSLLARNPYAEVNGSFIQLPSAPQEWDGSLWLPVSSLDELFPTTIELSRGNDTIRLLHIPVDSAGIAAETARLWRLGTVILDPGHGGKDRGGAGLFDLEEKWATFDIARRAQNALRNHGIDARMTRDGDEFLTLGQRTRMANRVEGDLFLSIHCNHFKDPAIAGAECYFLKPAKSSRAIEVATAENQVVELERGGEVYEELTEENFILFSMATSQYMKDSERWAGLVLDEIARQSGLASRGVDQAGFYVLMGASMPAILLECGYLSNPEDARILSSDWGRQKIADAIAASVLKMKTEMEAAAR